MGLLGLEFASIAPAARSGIGRARIPVRRGGGQERVDGELYLAAVPAGDVSALDDLQGQERPLSHAVVGLTGLYLARQLVQVTLMAGLRRLGRREQLARWILSVDQDV